MNRNSSYLVRLRIDSRFPPHCVVVGAVLGSMPSTFTHRSAVAIFIIVPMPAVKPILSRVCMWRYCGATCCVRLGSSSLLCPSDCSPISHIPVRVPPDPVQDVRLLCRHCSGCPNRLDYLFLLLLRHKGASCVEVFVLIRFFCVRHWELYIATGAFLLRL